MKEFRKVLIYIDSILLPKGFSLFESQESGCIFYDEYNKIKTIDSDDVLFMVNKNIKSIKDDERGGFHKTGGIGGVILKSSLDSAEAIAHELGHWLDLRHTKDEGTPTSIPESQTQNNFMDYNIKRKSWFRHQLDKTYKKNEQSN